MELLVPTTNKDGKPILTHAIDDPKTLLMTQQLARAVLRNNDPLSVQFEMYYGARRWVLHLTNKHRVELYIPSN